MARLMDPVDSVVLDRFAQLAARVLDVSIVCISLIDEHSRTVVSSHGLCAPSSMLLSWSFMNLMIASGHPQLITDGWTAPGIGLRTTVLAGNVAANVGMPLMTPDGRHVGTLTLMDRKPRRWSTSQIEFLKELSVRIVSKVDIGPVERMM